MAHRHVQFSQLLIDSPHVVNTMAWLRGDVKPLNCGRVGQMRLGVIRQETNRGHG